MKIVTVVGARPQFIKSAVVSHVLREKHREVLVHTGQHYDYNMSKRFFEELDIPDPDYNLGVSGGSHAQMTGEMMIAIEKVLIQEHPDWLLVYGDTNSTLAAALTAAKIHIPICHVEAGARIHSLDNPEEINRICTDHISSLLLASTVSSYEEMKKEGLYERTMLVGDPMYDAFLKYRNRLHIDQIILVSLKGEKVRVPKQFYYLTCHREENTNQENLLEIFLAMENLDEVVIYPVHPRNRLNAQYLSEKFGFHNLILVEPVGYLESICLVDYAKKVITDSGGLQREAFFAEKKCVTVFQHVIWPETMVDNRNILAKPQKEDILKKLEIPQTVKKDYYPFGNGTASLKIMSALEQY